MKISGIKTIRRWTLIRFLVTVIVMSLIVYAIWPSDPVRITCILAGIPYPPGKILHKKSAMGYFSGTCAFSFVASKSEINTWLRRCTDLQQNNGYVYTPKHQLISMSRDDKRLLDFSKYDDYSSVGIEGGNWIGNSLSKYEIVDINPNFPWFTPHTKHGIRYDCFPPDSTENYGEIFIDWDKNQVWVAAGHS